MGRKTKLSSPSNEAIDPEKSLLNYLDVLDPSALEAMEEDFQEVEEREGRGLTQVEFVAIMQKHIPPELFDTNMATALCDLFDQIDINGDEELEWEEFTGFLATGVNQSEAQDETRVRLFERSKIYDPGSAIFPDGIEKVFYIKSADKAVVCGTGQSSAKVFDAGTGRAVNTLRGHTKDVLAVADIGELGNDRHCFATAGADKKIRFWDSKTLRLHGGIGSSGTLESSDVVLSLCWLPAPQSESLRTPSKAVVRKFENDDNSPQRISRTQDLGVALPILPNFPVYTTAGIGGSISPRKPTQKRKSHYPGYKRTTDGEEENFEELYRGEYGLLAAGTTSGVIDLWDVDSSSIVTSLNGHHGHATMDIIHADSPEYLISASLDKTVRLWDVRRGVSSGKLEGHKKGVTCLSYSPEYKVIFSAGYDPYPLVWNPYVGSNFRFALKGHSCSLVGVQVIPGTAEVITADADGIFKLWDMRNFMCVQTFQDEAFEGILRSFTYSKERGRIISSAVKNKPDMETTSASMLTRAPVTQRVIKKAKKGQAMTVQHIHADENIPGVLPPYHERLHFFDQQTFEHLSDSKERSLGATWIKTNLTFITVTNTGFQVSFHRPVAPSLPVIHQKVWESMNGTMKKKFTQLVPASRQITCFCLDSRKRKLFIGDDHGGVYVFDTMKGSLMENLVSHGREISGVSFSQEINGLITSSWDASLRVYDSSSSEAMFISRELHGHGADVSALAVDDAICLIASGDIHGKIRVWDLGQSRRPHLLAEKKRRGNNGWLHSTEIVVLQFLPDISLLASADSEGKVLFWSIDTKKPVGGFWNSAMVTSMYYQAGSDRFITGDDQGHIKFWKIDHNLRAKRNKDGTIAGETAAPRQKEKRDTAFLSNSGKTSGWPPSSEQVTNWNVEADRGVASPMKRGPGGKVEGKWSRRRVSTMLRQEAVPPKGVGGGGGTTYGKGAHQQSLNSALTTLEETTRELNDETRPKSRPVVPPLWLSGQTQSTGDTSAVPAPPPSGRPPSTFSRRSTSRRADSRGSSVGGKTERGERQRPPTSKQGAASARDSRSRGGRGQSRGGQSLRSSMEEEKDSSDEEDARNRGAALWTSLFKRTKSTKAVIRRFVRNCSNLSSASGTFLTEIDEGDFGSSKAFVENVPLVSEFQAHNGEVVSLEIIDEPYSLLSCASDRSCCIWDPTNFKLIGELAFDVKARGRQRVWGFAAPWEKVTLERRDHTARVLRRVEGKVSEVIDSALIGITKREHMSNFLRDKYEETIQAVKKARKSSMLLLSESNSPESSQRSPTRSLHRSRRNSGEALEKLPKDAFKSLPPLA